jgi:hypothetical protein
LSASSPFELGRRSQCFFKVLRANADDGVAAMRVAETDNNTRHARRIGRMRGTHERELTVASVIRHALPSVLDGTIIPLVAFTILVHTWGVRAALWGTLVWAYGAVMRRAIIGRRIPGIVVLSTLGITLRMTTMIWTGSAFLFFVQPVLATMATAAAFGVSAVLQRPLTVRLGADLVPLPDTAWSDPAVHRACTRLAVVWGVALAANGLLTLYLLSHLSVATFVLVRPVVPLTTTLPAVVASFVVGRRVVARAGGRFALVRPAAASPAPARGGARAPEGAVPACWPIPAVVS